MSLPPEPELPAQRRPAEPASEARPPTDTMSAGRRQVSATSRYDLFVSVAADLDRVTTAYDAELLVSTMLGAAYSVADSHRLAAVSQTADGLRQHLARRRTRTAALLRAVLASLTPPPSRGRPPMVTDAPGWLPYLGAVKPTGGYTFGDEYRDQVTYLATFAYADEVHGGPEHAVAVLVDHNLGHVKDLFVSAPAGALLAQLVTAAETDETMRLAEVEPGVLRCAVDRYLAVTDELPRLPEAESLTSDRALAAHRLRLLPTSEAAPVLPAADMFRTAPEAARLAGVDEESLAFCLRLIVQYAEADPLRWSPAAVSAFLLDWVPARALLDRSDTRLLPTVLGAWVRWAGRVSGLTPRAVAATVAAIAQAREEFTARIRSGSHRSPAATAMAQLLADGVDLNDEQAVADWLAEYNARDS